MGRDRKKSPAQENRARLEWARARLLDAATETVCCIGDPRAMRAALRAQTAANDDWQIAQLAQYGSGALDPDDAVHLAKMDARRKAEVRDGR